jgi:sporulation protein YlmC with PRC-barrel domain
MTHIGLFGAGLAAACVAGTERRVFKETDTSRAINGVSAKRQLLGQKVYNDQGDMVGKIEDLILTKKVVTYAIVGAGGFLGLGTHDVAIPAGKFLRDEERVVLPDASNEALRDMPRFEYTGHKLSVACVTDNLARRRRAWPPSTRSFARHVS